MTTYDYEELLNRSMDSLPEDLTSKERFQMPEGDIFHEGNTTIIRNFLDVADRLGRDPQHLLSYLLKELGTAGELDNERAIFQGKISTKKVQKRIETYVNTFVVCRECGRPDTKLMKKNRTLLLKCEACGAMHPVKARKGRRGRR
ncbi:MAG: translation initiation factor IF-2 subunit beta [Candidatus Thermoplasmatota archaeon]|nr:translation initiation factor IF-2 subunit beta [Candidatus Thermoplasmatota archaeon]